MRAISEGDVPMKMVPWILVFTLLPVAAFAQQRPNQRPTIASEIGSRLRAAEREVLEVGGAMPDDRFNFAPTNGEFKGVRTFAQQLKHIAAFGYILCSPIRQEKPPVDTNGDAGPANITTKADILKFVQDSFAYCQQALSTITEQNALEPISGPFPGRTTRLALATFAASHPYDHYGQMVVYLRMNGKIPPASQPRPRAKR
jgi:uncharacterized damage-inducible protein DinB